MLKFIKHHLESMTGIEVYPLVSFIIFFVFFLVVFYFVIRADKTQIDEISRLPLDDNNAER